MNKPNDAWVDPDSGEPRVTPRPAPHKRPPREAGAAQAPQQPQAERAELCRQLDAATNALQAYSRIKGVRQSDIAKASLGPAMLKKRLEDFDARAGLQAAPQVPTDTPSSEWHKAGEPDPHGNRYDGERAELCMGNLSDDELANAMFLCDHRRSLESIGYLTAAKDRIRWLSRALERALAAPPEAALQPSPEARGAWISVSDRVPDPYTPVLALAGNVVVARREAKPPHQAGGYGWLVSSCGDRNVPWLDVTHWMPLPELPGGEATRPTEGREDVVQRLMAHVRFDEEPAIVDPGRWGVGYSPAQVRRFVESAIRTALQGSARADQGEQP